MAYLDGYSAGKTATKAIPAAVALAIAEGIFAAAQAAGLAWVTKDLCYQVAMAGLAGFEVLRNWIKNHKRGK
jgi:hypothetical protein